MGSTAEMGGPGRPLSEVSHWEKARRVVRVGLRELASP